MGSFDWQTLVALVLVTAAAVFVVRRVLAWASGTARTACTSCPARQEQPVVPLSALKLSASLQERTAANDPS